MTWETWSVGGEVDPREADYDLDAYVGGALVDHEAAVAAAASGVRRERGDREGGQRERDGEAGSENATPVNRGGGEDDGGGSGRTTTSDGCTSTGETIFRATDRFEWVVNAAPRGSGWKKRKALLRALAEAWGAAAQEDAEEMPMVRRMAIYRAMKGTMAAKQVVIELKTLAREGLVVVDGDGLRCGVAQEASVAATDDTAEVEPVASVDEAGGARRSA